MRNNDTAIGVVITLFSVAGFLYVHSLDFKSEVGLSPGVFPQFIFILMATCGIAIFFEGKNSNKKSERMNLNWPKLTLTVIAMVIHAYLLEYTGFIISTIMFLAATLYIFEEKRLKILITVPLLSAVLIYYSFTEIFLIPLP